MSSNVTIPKHLAGKFEGSFAHKTLSIRLPLILDKVIASIESCHSNDSLTSEAKQESRNLIEQSIQLKQDLVNNRPFTQIVSSLADTKIWNQYLLNQQKLLNSEVVNWLNVPWLYAECFIYRRLREVFASSKYFKSFDPFYGVKEEAFVKSVSFASNLAKHLVSVQEKVTGNIKIEDLFYFYVMTSLWGNQSDLSIACGDSSKTMEIQNDFASLEQKIIVNDYEKLWSYFQNLPNKSQIQIDIILDNSSYELFTDLCMVEFFHRSNLLPKDKTKVHLHVKCMPWFVSDALIKDVHWLLDTIENGQQFSSELKQVNALFKQNIDQGVWIVKENDFWTLPVDFSDMKEYGPELYDHLNHSDLVILKGDLNYRKLVGDLNWKLTTTFSDAIRNFKPTTAICSLRTIKADVVVGINDDKTLERVKTLPNDWMETGEFAVFHILDNNI